MIINRKRTLTSLIVVLSFLLGFYIIGSLFRVVLIAMATKETDTEEDNNETAAENVEPEETDKEDKEDKEDKRYKMKEIQWTNVEKKSSGCLIQKTGHRN